MNLTITFTDPVDFTDGKGIYDLEGRTVTVYHNEDERSVLTTGLVSLTSRQDIMFRQDGAYDPRTLVIRWDTVTSVVVHTN